MARFIIQMPPHSSRELKEVKAEYALRQMIQSVKMAEERGIYGISLAENPDLREPFLLLAAFALTTSRIKLVTSINSIYTRSPLLMAKTVANLDDLSNGRAMLGLARGTLVYANKEGVNFHRPVIRMKEYVEVLRLALRGEAFAFSGEIFNLKKAELGFTPIRKSIPLYIGASGPKTLQLAGEIADGVYPKAFSDVESFKNAIDNIHSGAKRAGRDPSKIDIVRSLMLSVCKDGDLARRIAKGKLIFHIVNNPQLRLTSEEEETSRVIQAIKSGDLNKACSLVPDSLVETLTISGTPEECEDKLKKYMEVFKGMGVGTFRIQPLGPFPKEAFESAVDILSAQM